MGAEVVEHFNAKAGNLAVARQRHFRGVDAIRPVRVAAQQVLDPVFDPFDMPPAGLARQQCHADDRVGKIFVPKEPPWGSGVMRILCAGTRSPRATVAT